MKTVPRPYRNQRLGRPKQRKKQQQLLEVSIRRDKERSRQVKRSLMVMWKVLLLSALVAGAWVGTREALQRFVWQNPLLFLTDVRVSSDGTLTREQILSTAGVVEGSNILSLDLGKVRTTLAQLPQVDRVEVQRSFPHRLDIEVTERQPVAWVTEQSDIDPTASDRAYLLDAHGIVMKSRKVLPVYAHLPLISGAVLENLAPGQKVKELELLSALELLHVAGDSTRWQIRNIDVSRGYCLVVTGREHAPIVFGLDRIDRQWMRFNRLLDYAESIHKELQTANFLVERNTPVTFYDPDAPETPPAVATPPGPAPKASAPAAGPKPPAAAPKTEMNKPGRFKTPAEVRKPFRMHG